MKVELEDGILQQQKMINELIAKVSEWH